MNTAHKCMGVEPSPGAPSSFYHGVQQVSIYESGGGTHTKTRTLYVCINSKSVFLYSSSASLNLIAYRWACVDLWWGSVMNMVMGFPTIIQYNSNNHFKRFWHCVLQIIHVPQIQYRLPKASFLWSISSFILWCRQRIAIWEKAKRTRIVVKQIAFECEYSLRKVEFWITTRESSIHGKASWTLSNTIGEDRGKNQQKNSITNDCLRKIGLSMILIFYIFICNF